MRILLDISHPASFHCFRTIIKDLISRGHQVKIIARDRPVIRDLLHAYNFDFVNRGAGRAVETFHGG